MGIKEKIERALRRDFEPAEVLLIDEGGISASSCRANSGASLRSIASA